MQKTLFLCTFLFLAVSLVDSKPPPAQITEWWVGGKSVILKSANFEEYIINAKNVIVEFVTPQSTEAQKIKGEWDKLAEMYNGDNPKRSDVNVALINGWTFSAISYQYGVKTFPSILLFSNGDAKYPKAVYDGEKTAEKINEWLESLISTEETGTNTQDNTQATDNAYNADTGSNADESVNQGTPEATQTQETQPETVTATDNNQQQQEQQQQQQQQEQQQHQQQEQPPQQQQQQAPPKPPVQQQQPPQQQQQQAPPKPPVQQQQQPPQQQQQQAPPKPPVQQQQQKQQENNNVAGQEEAKKEVKVVLNTTLLQSQFESLQQHLDVVTQSLKQNINDNVQKIEELRSLLNSQKQDLDNVQASLRGQATKFDELKQALTANKQDVQQSVTGHTEKHLEEVKGALHQIKGKVFEQKPTESKGFGSGVLYLLIGGLVGGAATFVFLNMAKNSKKRKLLID